MKNKEYWFNKKGDKIDIDSIEDVKYLQNILKMLVKKYKIGDKKQKLNHPLEGMQYEIY